MFRCREGTSNRGAHDGETSNFVFALPFFAHLTENFAVVAGPGLEVVSLEKGHDDEKESEFLVRFCTIYEVELDDWVFAPQLHGGLVSGRWTLVYGIAWTPPSIMKVQ